MSEFFRTTPPGLLSDDDAGFLGSNWQSVPSSRQPFYAAKLNEYQNFRSHYPRPLTPSEVAEQGTERARLTSVFENFDAATQGDSLGVLHFADAEELPRLKVGLANRAFVQHMTGVEGDNLDRDYELTRDALARKLFGGVGVADDGGFNAAAKAWLQTENGREGVERSLAEAGRRAAAWEGSGLAESTRPTLKTWQESQAGKPGYEMDFSGAYERTFRAAQAEARVEFARLRPFVDFAWQVLSGGKEGDTPGAVDFEGVADQLMQVPREDRRKVLSLVKARAELLPDEAQAGFWSRAGKTFVRNAEAIGQGAVNELPRIIGGIVDPGYRERQAIYEDVRNLQRLEMDPVTGRNGWEDAGLAVAGSLPGLAAMFTVSPAVMVGQFASDARQSMRSALEAEGVPPEFSGEVANGLAMPAAVAMTYVEKVTLGMANSFPGVKQLQAKLLTSLSGSAVKRAAAYAGAFALEAVEQNVQEALQDATPTILLEMAQTLGAPLPDVEAWAPAIETLTDPSSWAVAMVFAGFGFGRMPQMEAAQILRERGASDEQIQKVLAAPNADAHRAAVMAALNTPARTPTPIDLEQAGAEAAADDAAAGVASVTRDETGWWVTHEDGRRTKAESGIAARMLVEDLGQVAAQDEADAMVEIADWMVEKDARTAQTFSGAKVTTDGQDVFAEHKDRAPQLMPMDAASTAALGEEFQRLAAAEGGNAPMVRLIEGSNSIEWRERLATDAVAVVERMNLRQNKGGTVLTQFHERTEAAWRAGIDSGAITMGQTFKALRLLEQATGLQYLSEDPSETDVREAVSEAVSAYVFSRKRDGTRSPAGAIHKGMKAALEASTTPDDRAAVGVFRSMLRALRAYFRQLFKAAAAITKARREGKIKDGDSFTTFADKLLGVDGQRQHERAVVASVDGEGSTIEGNGQPAGETFALSASTGLDRLAIQIANRPSTPKEKAKVFNRMSAELSGMARSLALNDDNRAIIGITEARQAAKVMRAQLVEQYQNEVLADGVDEAIASAELATIAGNPFLSWLTEGTAGLGMRGVLMSRSEAIRLGKYDPAQGTGDYDNQPPMPSVLLRGTQMPDRVAREAHRENWIPEENVDMLWDLIAKELASVETWKQRVRSAETRLMEAKARAHKEARTFELEQVERARTMKSANAETDGKRALMILDKMLMSLPAEVRSKVGGFTRVVDLKTNDARFKYFSAKVVEIDRVLEHHLRETYLVELRALLKSSRPKAAVGERDKGILGTNAHSWLLEAERIMVLPASNLEAEEDTVEGRQAAADVSDAVVKHYARLFDFVTDEASARQAIDQHAAILNLFGGMNHRDGKWGKPIRSAGEIFAALEAAKDMATGGRLRRFKEIIARRERRAAWRETAVADAGGLAGAEERKEARRQEGGVSRGLRDWTNAQFSFESFVSSLFGEGSSTHRLADKRSLLADLAYRDAMRAREQNLGAHLRSLWPRSNTRQRQRNLQTLATSREVPGMPIGGAGKRNMSELDAVHYTMLWLDEDTASREWLDSHGYGEKPQKAMEAMLSDEAKAIRRWLVDGYAAQYDQINAVHRRMYGVNMPRVKNYAPRLVDHGGSATDMAMDPLGAGRQLMAGFTKRRRLDTKSPPRHVDALTAYWQNSHAVEYWTAWAETASDFRGIFSHWMTQAAVKAKNGDGSGAALNEWLQILERNGVQAANGQGLLRRWSSALADSALVGKLGVLGKQMIASYASASKLGIPEYLGAVKRIAEGKASITLAQIHAMPVIQRRMADLSPEVRTGTKGRGMTPGEVRLDALLSKVGADLYALDNAHVWLRERIGAMDALNTTLSAAAAYDVAFREAAAAGMPDAGARQIAMEAMEKTAADTAQPDSVRNKSLGEMRAGVWGRLLMPFQSANRQAFAMTLLAVKQSRWKDAGRRALLHWAVTGVVAQTIGNVMRSILSDDDLDDVWDWEDYARAVVIGPLTGAQYVGIGIEALVPIFGGFERRQAATPLGEGGRLLRMAFSGDFDYKEVTNTLNGVGLLIGGRASWASITANLIKQGVGVIDTVSRTDAEREDEQAKRDKVTIRGYEAAQPEKPEKPDAQKQAEKFARRAKEAAKAAGIRKAEGE